MSKIKITAVASAVFLLGGSTWFYKRADGKEAPAYKTAAISRASLKSTVTATGSLNAVRTVQVGTQVSGQVSQIYADFNDHVKKGQLLARIDPRLQEQAVQDAQAQLERAQATLTQAQAEYDRNKKLLDAKVITPSEFGTVQSNFSVQQATVKSANIALERARQNLAYTSIFAPIDGVIVERNVDVGQTVAASLSAPQLFLIANDLSEMQILASVDESDIGLIKNGQPVQFTVQSYPNQTFSGTVQQVRLQSTMQDNVVNYTVVIAVKNQTGKLLPGMTATVQFQTGSADNVLTVANAALRFRPTEAMLAEAGFGPQSGTPRDSTAGHARVAATGASGAASGAAGGGRGGRGGQAHAHTGSGSFAILWTLDSAGKVKPIRVRTGLTDGQKTEVQSPALVEGTQVIVGAAASGAGAATVPAASPFQAQRRGGRGF